jgi:hypothetical protein
MRRFCLAWRFQNAVVDVYGLMLPALIAVVRRRAPIYRRPGATGLLTGFRSTPRSWRSRRVSIVRVRMAATPARIHRMILLDAGLYALVIRQLGKSVSTYGLARQT